MVELQLLSRFSLIVDGLLDHVEIIIVLAGQRLLVAFLAGCKLLGQALSLLIEDSLELLSSGVVAQSSLLLNLLLVHSDPAPLVNHKISGLSIVHELFDVRNLPQYEPILDFQLAVCLGAHPRFLPEVLSELFHLAAVSVEEDRHSQILRVCRGARL